MMTTEHPSLDSTGDTAMLETPVRVSGKQLAAEDVVQIELTGLADEPLPAWEPGAHIDLVIEGAPTRQYSLCGSPSDRRSYQVGVLRDAAGRGGSIYIHDELEVGDVLMVRGPRNHFHLVEAERVLFIAGGIGITPLLPMIEATEAAGRDWQLLYGGRRLSSMAFRDRLAQYGSRVVISPADEHGLLDLPSHLNVPRSDTAIYCCGPEPLLAAVQALGSGWSEGSIHFERFAPKEAPPPVLDAAFQVVCAYSNVELTVEPGESIIDVVADAGVPVSGSCFEGTCGTCQVPVLEGEPDHQDSVLTPDEQASNSTMMICVSRSRTPRLVLDI
nr:PDR/VanB family oxidoreductase [Rhodococcus wratislaviensis]GLK33171.1 ferredoxin [Rhodococcus wratislaviensis]